MIFISKRNFFDAGGCVSESPPCEYWCKKRGGSCNASTGLCHCPANGVSRIPRILTSPTSPSCSLGAKGPHPPANHSAPTPEIRLMYYPDDSKVSFWMYAMISIGTAFVIFVAVTVYLMCRSSLRQRSVSVERQPSVRRRVNANRQIGDHCNTDGFTNSTGNSCSLHN
ncbi:uncharacterized protein NPIL_332211 [Nephila pilipes]|uniref:Uncharacterized protein n=1 Tax=Nephila pilipes TaxID=299642 RepID=A0A8X6NKS7_NEPPI|nr:uncharacterized protein NPIL_332211 [Nephila pilipes]